MIGKGDMDIWQMMHQENNTLLGWLEMLETTRLARDTRSSLKILKNFL